MFKAATINGVDRVRISFSVTIPNHIPPGDIGMIGFSPRSQALTLYLIPPFTRYASLMKKLGKYRTGQGCLDIKKLEDVDLQVQKEIVTDAYRHTKEKYS
jgi:hypothetical protein